MSTTRTGARPGTLQPVSASSRVSSDTGWNPCPTSDTVVNDLTVTIAASTIARTAVVSAAFNFNKSTGNVRFVLYVDGAAYWPATGRLLGDLLFGGSAGDKGQVYAGIVVPIPGDGATHTIDLRGQADSTTTAVTWRDRHLSVLVY